MVLCITLKHNVMFNVKDILIITHHVLQSCSFLCSVQEAEQEEVKVMSDPQPPRSAKKGKASASSTPQTGSEKKERKGKHKGQCAGSNG